MKWLIRAAKPLAAQVGLLVLQAAVDLLVEQLQKPDAVRPPPANDNLPSSRPFES